MSIITGIALVSVGLYVAALGGLYAAQRSMVFNPDKTHVLPADVGLTRVDEVTLTTDEGRRLFCWYLEAEPAQPTFVYFHGNGGSVATRVDPFRALASAGYGVFMLGYPGYGGSEGDPSERGFVEGARLAYRHLRNRGLEPESLVIFGESLGTSVAVQLAAESEVRALILAAPMTSARAMAKERYPYLPMTALLRDPFLSSEFIGRVDEPLLIIHGDSDEAVPLRYGRELFAMAGESKILHVVKGGGHNDLFEFPILGVMNEFLNSLSE